MDDFGQAEQADDHRDEGDARHEVFVFEGEAHGPGGTGDAHGGEEDAHARAEDALEDGGARNAAHYGQGQQDEAALLDGADFEGEIGQGAATQMSRMLLNVSPNTEPTSAALRPLPALPCLVRG